LRGAAQSRLREAARDAVARGTPAAAIAFLRRAERERPEVGDRPTTLLELG